MNLNFQQNQHYLLQSEKFESFVMAYDDVFQTAHLLKYQLNQDDIEAAKQTARYLKNIVDMDGFEYTLYGGMETNFCKSLHELIELAASCDFEIAMNLVYCKLGLARRLFQGVHFLEEIKIISGSVRTLAEKQAELRKKEMVVQTYPVLEELMNLMENFSGAGVSTRGKIVRLSSVMADYAHCFNLASEPQRAIPLLEHAIKMLKQNGGSNIKTYKSTCYLYYDLGLAYLSTAQFADDYVKAQDYFKLALTASEDARDFDKEEKKDLILLINTKANVVANKLPYMDVPSSSLYE